MLANYIEGKRASYEEIMNVHPKYYGYEIERFLNVDAWVSTGAIIGASTLPVTLVAGLTIASGVLIGVSVDMYKESISN